MRDLDQEKTNYVFCINCKHCVAQLLQNWCVNPVINIPNLVTGVMVDTLAAKQRYEGKCGLQGKYFELKETK